MMNVRHHNVVIARVRFVPDNIINLFFAEYLTWMRCQKMENFKQDSYGYEISQTVKMVASIKESTLYTILRKLETGGYLTTYSEEFQGRKRKYYSITEAGREQLEYLRKEWREYRDTIDDIVEGRLRK